MKTLIFLALVGTALCRVAREKRQVNCQEPDIANVCTTSAAGRIYFPHPTDRTKFLQCADGGRMFIIQCPKGEMFDSGRSSCGVMQTIVTPSTTLCTATNIAIGNVFFPYPGDNTRFIQCTGLNQPTVLTCPDKLTYDTNRQSCVYPAGTVGTGTVTQLPAASGTVGGSITNPCTQQAILNNNLFFPHPDPTKFIQCDLAGDVYVMQCPANLVWNQNTENCDTAYSVSGGVLLG